VALEAAAAAATAPGGPLVTVGSSGPPLRGPQRSCCCGSLPFRASIAAHFESPVLARLHAAAAALRLRCRRNAGRYSTRPDGLSSSSSSPLLLLDAAALEQQQAVLWDPHAAAAGRAGRGVPCGRRPSPPRPCPPPPPQMLWPVSWLWWCPPRPRAVPERAAPPPPSWPALDDGGREEGAEEAEEEEGL